MVAIGKLANLWIHELGSLVIDYNGAILSFDTCDCGLFALTNVKVNGYFGRFRFVAVYR